jgi:hypothetical protein
MKGLVNMKRIGFLSLVMIAGSLIVAFEEPMTPPRPVRRQLTRAQERQEANRYNRRDQRTAANLSQFIQQTNTAAERDLQAGDAAGVQRNLRRLRRYADSARYHALMSQIRSGGLYNRFMHIAEQAERDIQDLLQAAPQVPAPVVGAEPEDVAQGMANLDLAAPGPMRRNLSADFEATRERTQPYSRSRR